MSRAAETSSARNPTYLESMLGSTSRADKLDLTWLVIWLRARSSAFASSLACWLPSRAKWRLGACRAQAAHGRQAAQSGRRQADSQIVRQRWSSSRSLSWIADGAGLVCILPERLQRAAIWRRHANWRRFGLDLIGSDRAGCSRSVEPARWLNAWLAGWLSRRWPASGEFASLRAAN